MKIALLAGVIAGSLALTAPAIGAMYVRMSLTPPAPQAGQTARLSVQTGAVQAAAGVRCLSDSGASFEPMHSEDWYTSGGKGLTSNALAAVAIGPDAKRVDITLMTRADDTSYWDGDVRFDTPGAWIIRMARPEWSDEDCAGARLQVTVRAGSDDRGPLILSLAVAAVALVVASFVVRARRAQ